MPLPAGYSLDNGSGTLPDGYKLDTNYSPVVPSSGAHDSLVSDALKYSPAGAVKGLADAIRSDVQNPSETGSGVVQTMKANAGLLDRTKESFKRGGLEGVTEAVGHFLNYLNPFGQAFEDISGDLQKKDYSHAAAKTAGLASNFGVPAVMEGITSPEAARVPGAIVEGVKAAAPDVAKGAAKAAVGEVIAKVPGMEWPARVGVQYPAVRQMKAGGAAGVKAFKAALQDKIQAIVDNGPAVEESAPEGPPQKLLNAGPIVTPPPADASFVRGETQEWSPSQGKWVPKGTAPDAVAPPAKTETPAPKTPAINPDTAQLDAIAQEGVFGKKYKSFAAAPAEAQATIRGVVQGMAGKSEPVTAPLPQTAAPGNAPVTSPLKVVRWQSSSGEPETGNSGGTFYLSDNQAARGNNPYSRPSGDSVLIGSGGDKLIEGELSPQKTLTLKYDQPKGSPPKQLGTQIIDKLSPLSRSDIEAIIAGGDVQPGSDGLSYLSEEIGIPEDKLHSAIERGRGASYDDAGITDAIAVELLKKHGYDAAVQSSGNPQHLLEVLHIGSPSDFAMAPKTTSLRDMMRNLPEEEARAEFLRQREAGTSAARAVADGMYAQGKQGPGEAAKTYEAAARSDKAQKLAQALHDNDVSAADLEPHQASELVKTLELAAKAVGVKAPSTTTIPEVLFHLKRLEAAKAKAGK